MTINGLYQQMAGSTLDILLGGANAGQFGQLIVNGDAVLGGTLDVELFNGFDPTSGEVFKSSAEKSAAHLPIFVADPGRWLVSLVRSGGQRSLHRRSRHRDRWWRRKQRAGTAERDFAGRRALRDVWFHVWSPRTPRIAPPVSVLKALGLILLASRSDAVPLLRGCTIAL